MHLEDKDVIKDERIEGFDWIKLVMAYNKIIENQDIDFGGRAKFKSRLKFILNDLQNSFIGKKPKR